MDKETTYLVDWTEVFLKNRDLMLRKIKGIEKKENKLFVTFKDKEQIFMIYPTLTDIDTTALNSMKNPTFVMLNSEENIIWTLKNWAKLIQVKTLSMFFVNPFSEGDKRWIIFPNTHHQVTEPEALELGLRSMAEAVVKISKEEFSQKI
jgi:hypothetical protein